MIKERTVFVLGAGASCSYGFPSGESLKKEAADAVDNSLSQRGNDSYLMLHHYRVAPIEHVQNHVCRAFVEALSNAGQGSIDAFLHANRHRPGFDVIGKAAIAQVLLRYEENASLQSKDDWLKYLFQKMIDGASTPEQFLGGNNVAFITFNYDRFLERWLHTKIKFSFGLDDGAALSVLRKISIHHVYGMLGSFPDSNQHHQHKWIPASTGIQTIFDAERNTEELQTCRDILRGAHVICLLGFGFHEENIELIGLRPAILGCPGVVAASRFGLSDIEWSRAMSDFSPRTIYKAAVEDGCLNTLRNTPIF